MESYGKDRTSAKTRLRRALDEFVINGIDTTIDLHKKIVNHKDFIENRHDQSVYSLLCKKYKLQSFSAFECDWAYLDNDRTWEHNKNSPILAKRDLEYSILKRFFNRQKKNIRRLIRNILYTT